MAERRMYAKTIVLSDDFLDMPMSARCLYFTLGMVADDDGFVNSPKSVMRQCGASQDDMKILLAKSFILAFESGVVVIRDWRINNYLRNDRYTETKFVEEKSQLVVEKSGAYSLDAPDIGIPHGIPAVYPGKVRLGEDRLEKEIPPKGGTKKEGAEVKPERHKYGEYGWVLLTDEQRDKLVSEWGQAEFDRCVRYVDENAQGNGNKNEWKDWNLVLRRCHREGWGKRDNADRGATDKPRRKRPDVTNYDYTGYEDEIWREFET